MNKKRVFNLLLALVLCIGMAAPVAAAGIESTDYDGYSFNLWVTSGGDTRGASFQKFYNSYYMNMSGSVNGTTITIEAAGDNQYYLRAICSYNTIYLYNIDTTDEGQYYLGGTTNKNAALKWSFGSDGRIHTTINSADYVLCLVWNTQPYNGDDGFRLTTDKTDCGSIYYPRMTFSPAETPHSHPVCGAACTPEESHDTLSAFEWGGGASDAYGTLSAGDYYLNDDLSIGKNLYIDGTVRICLNGHKLNFVNGYGLHVSRTNAVLEICDCQGTGSINSFPKAESGYYVYNNNTIEVAESGSLTLYGCIYCMESGTNLVNKGTATLYNCDFRKGIENNGTLTTYQTSVSTNYGPAIFNSSSAIKAEIHGGSFQSVSPYRTIGNYAQMTIDDAEISAPGSFGISNSGNGSLEIHSGTISGTKGGIENSGYESNGQIVKGSLEINGNPSIDKIVLEYPETLSFNYTGTTPIDLEIEIDDDFPIGSIVWDNNPENISLMNLLNEGYALEVSNTAVVLSVHSCENGHSYTMKASGTQASAATCTEPAKYYVQCNNCDAVSSSQIVPVGEAKGHSWMDATCTESAACSRCGETEGNALDHDWSAWQLTQEPTYIRSGEESRTCGRCGEPQNRPIAPTGQATADNIRKEQDGGNITLDGVPEDMIVLVAAYRNGQLLFVQVLDAGAIRNSSVPESVTWDTVKVLFVTEDWIPVARAEEYFA